MEEHICKPANGQHVPTARIVHASVAFEATRTLELVTSVAEVEGAEALELEVSVDETETDTVDDELESGFIEDEDETDREVD